MSVSKQSAIIFGVKWLLLPLDFVTGALVARAIGPEGKGVLMLIGGLAGSIMSFANLGMPYGAAYFYKQGRYTLGQIVTVCFLLTIIPSTLAFLGFVLISDSFSNLFMGTVGNSAFQPVWIWLPLVSSLLHMLFSVGDVLLIRDNKMKLYGIKAVSTPIVRIALIWLLTLALDWGVVGILWSQLIANVIGIGIPVYWLAREGAFSTLQLSLNATKDMGRIGLQRYGITMVTMVSKRFDVFLIAGLLSVQDVGYFAIAIGLLNIFLSMPRSTMWPFISKLAGKDKDKHSQFAKLARIQFMLILILVTLFATIAPLFIRIVYGEAFRSATGAVWLILPGVVAASQIFNCSAYFASRGQPGRDILPSIFSTLIQVGVSLVLVPKIGAMGGAIGLSTKNIALAIIQTFLVVRDGNLRASEMVIMTRQDWSFLSMYLIKILSNRSQNLFKSRK